MTNQTTPELLREIADVMEERPEDGYKEFEHNHFPDTFGWTEYEKWRHVLTDVFWNPTHIRRKPRTIQACGMEWPAPEKKAPPVGTTYWSLHAALRGVWDIGRTWASEKDDRDRLRNGQVYLSKADRDAAAEAIIKIQTRRVE